MEITTNTRQGENALLAGVRSALDGADSALLCVAFVQTAGVHLVRRQMERLATSTRLLLTTVFSQSASALRMAQGFGASVSILNPGSGTFHPKIYLARRGSDSVAVIGSANLTGGLISNVEAAVMLRGSVTDEPIRAAWEFAETLWSDPRRTPWTSADELVEDEVFDPSLYALLQAAVDGYDGLFTTLDQGKPNWVTAITPAGLYVETASSKAKRNKPQLTPAWMFTLAWEYLRTHGRLTNRYLLADDGLNVKRSSGVCAILARLRGTRDGRPRVGNHVDLVGHRSQLNEDQSLRRRRSWLARQPWRAPRRDTTSRGNTRTLSGSRECPLVVTGTYWQFQGDGTGVIGKLNVGSALGAHLPSPPGAACGCSLNHKHCLLSSDDFCVRDQVITPSAICTFERGCE